MPSENRFVGDLESDHGNDGTAVVGQVVDAVGNDRNGRRQNADDDLARADQNVKKYPDKAC